MSGEVGGAPRPSWLTRLGWLVGIWAASVMALAAFAWVLKLLMGLAGLRA